MLDKATTNQISGILLAAGMGERLGQPKAYLKYQGMTLLEHAVNKIQVFVSELIIALPQGYTDEGKKLINHGKIKIIQGGLSRHETVRRLLEHTTKPTVLLHEVARPFVSEDLFLRLIKASKKYPAVSPYLPYDARDTLIIIEDEKLKTALPKNNLGTTHTPQIYNRELLFNAYNERDPTDDAISSTSAFLHKLGHAVHLIPGCKDSLKLTYPEDLKKLGSAELNDNQSKSIAHNNKAFIEK